MTLNSKIKPIRMKGRGQENVGHFRTWCTISR